jgi:hypothetical protein
MQMNKSTQLKTIGFINASGTSERDFYSAFVTNRFYASPSTLSIKIDEGLTAPYLKIELTALQNISKLERCLLLLEQAVKQAQVAVNGGTSVDCIWLISSSHTNCAEQWPSAARKIIESYFPDTRQQQNTLLFIDGAQPENNQQQLFTDISNVTQNTLILALDSLVDVRTVKALNTTQDIQLVNGPAGSIASEGLVCIMAGPEVNKSVAITTKGDRTSTCDHVERFHVSTFSNANKLSLAEQITQEKISLNDTVIHVGTASEQWTRVWYGATQMLYRQEPLASQASCAVHKRKKINIYDLNAVIGDMGCANLLSSFILAKAIINDPVNTARHVYVINHTINSKSNQDTTPCLYRIGV